MQEQITGALIRARIKMQHLAAREEDPPGDQGDRSDPEEGSTTVEYAIGAVATAAFAGLLLAVLKSGGVKQMLNNIIQTALSM